MFIVGFGSVEFSSDFASSVYSVLQKMLQIQKSEEKF